MDNNRKPKIDFELGKKYKIQLIFDECKSGKTTRPDGKSYNWYLYQCQYNSNEYTFFADYDLHDELKKYGRGDILEIQDNYTGDNPYGHDWSVMSVGVTGSLDKIMKDSKNKTEIKIETFAAMKIAAHFSKNIDELDLFTQSVLELHKRLCNESLNNDLPVEQRQEVEDKIEELF
mgnify:CR=1 FL=1